MSEDYKARSDFFEAECDRLVQVNDRANEKNRDLMADNEALREALEAIRRVSGTHPVDALIHKYAVAALERQSVEGGDDA